MNVRIIAMTIVAAGCDRARHVASAQNVPSQFVVSGKAAEQIQDFTTINLATAERDRRDVREARRGENVAISIYVLDNDGNHVYMDRMDGQAYLNIITAEMKARTALMQRGAEQGRHEPGPPESEYGTAADSARHVRQLRRPARCRQQADDRRHRHRRLRAARAGVERRDLRPQGAAAGARRGQRRAARRGSAAIRRTRRPRTPRRFRDSRRRRRRRRAVSNPEWVVGGKGAANVFDGNQISLAAAKKIAQGVPRLRGGARTAACRSTSSTRPASSCTCERMDGQVFNNIRTALMKAETSLKTRVPTSVYTAQGRNNPVGPEPHDRSQYDFFTNAGGLPIVVDGQMIGVVGVGGGARRRRRRELRDRRSRRRPSASTSRCPTYPAATTAAR